MAFKSTSLLLFRSSRALACQNAPHRSVQACVRNAAGLHRRLQRFISGIGNRRHQQRVDSGQNGAHRGLTGSETRGDPAHIHGVGHHQALEMQFVAQQSSQYIFGKRSRSIGVRLERRNRKVPGHDAADSRGNRGTEGN